MRKILAFLTLTFLAFPALGAIKFFTDYPNGAPLDSDFFVYQRNQTYGNASGAQVKVYLFASPVMTGNGRISGDWVVGGVIWGNGAGITNVGSFAMVFTNLTVVSNATFNSVFENFTTNFYSYTTNLISNFITVNQPGGFTNLNLVPNSLMMSSPLDAEASLANGVGILTNDGLGGMGWTTAIRFTELDALNAYITNLFTFITNAPLLATDGNGKLVSGVPLSPTNILISSGANITFTTNVDGSITIAASGNITIQAITNNTFVNTNVMILQSNATFTIKKGATLIIETNGFLVDSNLTANSAVITDARQNVTNSVNAAGAYTNSATGPPSFGLVANNLLQNSSVTFSGTANQITGGGATALGASATAFAIANPLIAPGPISASGMTNTGFSAVGVLTNDANGKHYTTPTLPNALLANSFITVQGANVSLGSSTLAAGSSPSFNELNSTNFNYLMPTNNGNGGALVFGGVGVAAKIYYTNITANTTLAAFTITTTDEGAGIKIRASCSGGTDRTLTFPNGCVGAGSLGGAGKPPVVTITNGASAWFDVIVVPGQDTNVFWAPVF